MKILALLAVMVLGAVADLKAATLPAYPKSYQIVLTWSAATDQTDPANSYKVYSQLNGTGSFAFQGSTSASTLTYTDTQVEYGNSYTYYVTAIDANNNESVASNTWTGNIPFVPLPPILGTLVVQ